MKRILFLLVAVATLVGCGSSERSLLESIKEEFKKENYDEVIISADKFKIKFPNSDSLNVVEEIHKKSKNFNNALQFKRSMGSTSTAPVVVNDNTDELGLFNEIEKGFKNKKYMDVTFNCEKFYKNFRTSSKMDSVEMMYEKAMDKLEAQEMKEYGSLAFKRYKLHENPILNPNPKMSAPADQFLDRFTGRGSDFAKHVKNQLQEPNSFEYIETKYMNKNSGYIALVMRFKANNGLGLVVEREALGKFDKITETFTDIKIRD